MAVAVVTAAKGCNGTRYFAWAALYTITFVSNRINGIPSCAAGQHQYTEPNEFSISYLGRPVPASAATAAATVRRIAKWNFNHNIFVCRFELVWPCDPTKPTWNETERQFDSDGDDNGAAMVAAAAPFMYHKIDKWSEN